MTGNIQTQDQNRNQISLPDWWIIVVVLLASFALWSSQLSEPFIGRHENNTAYMTIAGENYLQYGYFDYGLAPIMHTDPGITSPYRFYWNHPPLGGILASIGLALFGVAEVSSRLIPIFLTMLGMSAFARWLKRTWGMQITILTIMLFAAFPMIAYYGQMLNHEPLILGFALLLLPLLDHRQHNSRPRQLMGISILTLLMVLSGWQALFFSAIYFIYAIWIRDWKLAILLPTMSIVGVLLWTLPLALQFPVFIENLYNQFLYRSGLTDVTSPNLIGYLWEIIWARWRPRYTEAAALLAVSGFFVVLASSHRRASHQVLLTLLLPVPAILQVLIFQQQTFTHDYTLYYFAPAVALFSAISLYTIWQRTRSSRGTSRWLYAGTGLVLVVAFALSSLRWTHNLYTTRDRFPVDIATVLQEETESGEIIYSNNPGWITAAWYYSQRDFQSLEQAPDQDYIALICTTESSFDAETFRAGDLNCILEKR